jgi:hypothetical protein
MAAPSARVSPCTASSFPNRRLSPVVSMLFTEKSLLHPPRPTCHVLRDNSA